MSSSLRKWCRAPTFARRHRPGAILTLTDLPMIKRCAVMLSLFAAAPSHALAQSSAQGGSGAKSVEESAPVGVLPAWLSVGGQLRARVEAYENGGFKPDNSDQYVLTRILLNARVRPTNGTTLFVEGMDSRGPWKNKAPSGAPFRDHADLRQLYLQLGTEKSANMLRAGRLELDFGDGRLVGSLPWANTARTFDGARGRYAGSGYRLDAFATSVVKVEQDRFDRNISMASMPASRSSRRKRPSSLSCSGADSRD
jgi:hypothetical protein